MSCVWSLPSESIKARFFGEPAFLHIPSSTAWMSAEIWLPTGDRIVYETRFGVPVAPYCNQIGCAAERCQCITIL